MTHRHRRALPAIALILPIIPFIVFPSPLGAESGERGESAFLAGFGGGIRANLGQVEGLSLGLAGNLAYRASDALGLELAVSARTLIGWDLGASLAALRYFGKPEGAWRFAVGPFAGASYGSRIVGTNQDDGAIVSGHLGPWWSFSGGIVVSPLEFRGASREKRFLRLALGAEYSWGRLGPFAELEFKALLWRLK